MSSIETVCHNYTSFGKYLTIDINQCVVLITKCDRISFLSELDCVVLARFISIKVEYWRVIDRGKHQQCFRCRIVVPLSIKESECDNSHCCVGFPWISNCVLIHYCPQQVLVVLNIGSAFKKQRAIAGIVGYSNVWK